MFTFVHVLDSSVSRYIMTVVSTIGLGMIIVTHSGKFHADDAWAVAVLK